jgi:hypothetical protein
VPVAGLASDRLSEADRRTRGKIRDAKLAIYKGRKQFKQRRNCRPNRYGTRLQK